MLDRYWHGSTSRISPEAPVPVVKVEDTEERAGGAGNVALNIASLGGRVSLLGMVGKDEAADALNKSLSAQGVECRFIEKSRAHTITKLRVMSRHQQLIRLDFEDGFIDTDLSEVDTMFAQTLPLVNGLVLSDYGKGTLKDAQKLISMACAQGVPVFVDPKGVCFDKYHSATLLTPNQSEFEAVVGECSTEAMFIEKGEALRKQLNLEALLVTRSEKGMALFERDKSVFMQVTQAKEVFDVTGAGDTVIATLAAAVCAGESYQHAVQLANLAAGIVVGKVGTATVCYEELKKGILKQDRIASPILTEREAITVIREAQNKKERVVMTNGCFDILHPGHVAYLRDAADLGERLIIAVNSDESVKRLKGEQRPINPLEHRMAMLSALECVDWVVAFSEDTPERLIGECLPDVLVKGGDYEVHDIAGGSAVIAKGGEVKILRFLEGYSTSNIINQINKKGG